MSLSHIKNTKIVSFLICSFLFIVSCGKLPMQAENEGTGTIEVRAMVAPELVMAKKATTYDSLIVEIRAVDMQAIRFSKKIDSSRPFIIDSFPKIPAGKDRIVTIYTIDRGGSVVHVDSADSKRVDIEPNSSCRINAVLIAAVGSIYLQIGSIPTTVDSIIGIFSSTSGSVWGNRVRRSPKVSLSIDKIPHNTNGKLTVVGVSITGDTLYKAVTDLLFDARRNSYINLNFQSNPGSATFELTIPNSMSTLACGQMSSLVYDSAETGLLIISEIMYAANDSEYVEIYNPGNDSLFYDSLILDIDGTSRVISNVAVGAKKVCVIGRKSLPWAPYYPSSASFLDLTLGGNWITIKTKNGTIIDRVAFTGSSNTVEWPVVSGKRSIRLASGSLNAIANNFGANWITSDTLIDSTLLQYGTPGTI
jgi:hypothetical protein